MRRKEDKKGRNWYYLNETIKMKKVGIVDAVIKRAYT